MKKLSLFILTIIVLSSQINAQTGDIKSYPLKDYVAPDIKYRALDLNTYISLTGANILTTNDYSSRFSGNANMYFHEYQNTKKVQRITDAIVRNRLSSTWEKDDSIKSSKWENQLSLVYIDQNRFYNADNTFWGIHGIATYNLSPSRSTLSSEEDLSSVSHNLNIIPYISYGKGRIQPVKSAREAMDILISLQKNNRLKTIPGHAAIDSLAQVANKISFKRFYDFRYKRIYQLKELDKELQRMDLIDSIDMIYFTSLNDIWSYAVDYNRGSGKRYETGLIPKYVLHYYLYNNPNRQFPESKYQANKYGIYAYLSYNNMKPINYTWQSDIMVDLTFGYEKVSYHNDYNNNITTQESDNLEGMLNASWQLGYYPNTRTYAGLTTYAATSYLNNERSKNEIGISTGFLFDAYYYLSPRLRLSIYSSFNYQKNFDTSTPSPFWNNALYNQLINNYQITNLDSQVQYQIPNSYIDAFNYSFRFSLTYSIL